MPEWWNIVDSVCLVASCENEFAGRRDNAVAELRRVGIPDDMARIQYVKVDKFDEVIAQSIRAGRKWFFKTHWPALSRGHRQVVIEALMSGHGSVMVVEDDVKFVDDLDEIAQTFSHMPDGDGLFQVEWMPDDASTPKYDGPDEHPDAGVSSYWKPCKAQVNGAACYILRGRRVMEEFVGLCSDFSPGPPDFLFHHMKGPRWLSRHHLAIQRPYVETYYKNFDLVRYGLAGH